MTPTGKKIFCLLVLLGGLSAAAQTPEAASRPAAPAQPPARSAGYWLRVKTDRVNLRARPDANSLVVAQLDRDAVLRGVNSEFGWQRVLPPAGVFSYVAAEYVTVQDEKTGVVAVASGQLRVRPGSLLTETDPAVSDWQTLLPAGTTVQILGRQGAWLKIVPPKGVYLYVSNDYVEPLSDEAAAQRLAAAPPLTSRPAPSNERSHPAEIAAANPPPGARTATQPASQPAPIVDLRGPWGRKLAAVETQIETEIRKSPLAQAWRESIAQLKPIADQREEPAVARLAAGWLAQLEQRQTEQETLRVIRQIADRQSEEERQFAGEIERIRQAPPPVPNQPVFDARGELAATGAGNRRYKLQNPQTRRVKAYVEFDAKTDVSAYLGKYVGVRGERTHDAALGADVIRVAEIVVLP